MCVIFEVDYNCYMSQIFLQVCFSDESTIEILEDRTQFIRRRPEEEFFPECVVQKVKFPQKIMVWSVISCKGPGQLYVVQNTMRTDQYLNVLNNILIPQLNEWFPDGNCVFMQDSAPCHVAKKVKGFFSENGLEVLPWPGNSPDMNPIEGIWNDLKNKVNKEIITNKAELTEKLTKIWHQDPEIPLLIEKHINSMPNRIAALIKAKGGFTKY